MIRYIIKRLLILILVMWASALLIFTITYFTPGDPALIQLGTDATEQELAARRAYLGIDKPYMQQLVTYMYNTFVRFDLGQSWRYETPVLKGMFDRMPYTLMINILSLIINVVIGLSLGIFAGTHEGKWQDSLTMAIAMIFVSAPGFWVCLEMQILFSVKLGWLPAYGINNWKCFIMPIIGSSIGGIAVNARHARSSILEVFRADYITTARAKGQAEKLVVRKHMLPNALMPIITNLGGALSHKVGGAAIMETVFSIPGVGSYMLQGTTQRDYPVIRGCSLFFATFSAFVMLLVDLAYAYFDPRIKAQYENQAVSKRKVKV